MKRTIKIATLIIASLLVWNHASAQQREFNSAIKKAAITFDGYYFVDLSRENYTPEEVGLFAKENGYVIHSLNQRKVDLRGETYIYANTLTMLPKGEDPDLVRGHSNPVNEPY